MRPFRRDGRLECKDWFPYDFRLVGMNHGVWFVMLYDETCFLRLKSSKTYVVSWDVSFVKACELIVV